MRDQLNLERLTKLVEATLTLSGDPDEEVNFGFGYLAPTKLHSYRGYYSDLAIGYGDAPCTIGGFLEELKAADGKTFYGWKGGEFRMGPHTPVWAANPGEAPPVAVVGFRRINSILIIETEYHGS